MAYITPSSFFWNGIKAYLHGTPGTPALVERGGQADQADGLFTLVSDPFASSRPTKEELSRRACRPCPTNVVHCDVYYQQTAKVGMRKAFLISFSIAVTLFAVAGYRTLLVHEMREPVLARLDEPKSVDFKGEVYLGDWTASGGTLCGEVAVTDAGKRTEGYQWFSAADGVFIENNGLRRQFDQAGIKRCTGERPPNTPWWWLNW